jgi:5'-3' exonuclease
MLALVDADTIAYRCAASCEPTKIKPEREPLDLAIRRADELCYRILSDAQSEKYRFFLTGSENFRKLIYPEYKANRARLPRPEWLEPVREFLITEWKAEIATGCEADDYLGIYATQDSIICGNDKDLLQIPGQHYNFVTGNFLWVDDEAAAMALWSQMLIGDPSDNLPGIDGLGKVKARRRLEGLSPREMEDTVRSLYTACGRDFLLYHRLYRLIRSEQELEEILNHTTKRKGQRKELTEMGSKEDSGSLPETDHQ